MKKILPLILISILCVFSLSACGQKGEYPYRDIELVIPASPGGGSDIMGRLLVEIIQNKKLCPRTITQSIKQVEAVAQVRHM